MEQALRAIANPRRRAMLELVWDGERTAGEIAVASGLSAPGHLAAPARPARRGPRPRARGRQPPPVPLRRRSDGRAARRARGVLGRAARADARRGRGPRPEDAAGMTSDDDAVVAEISVCAPAAVVYELFTEPAALVRWIGVRALLEPRPGGVFRFELLPGEFCSGRYVELVPRPPRRLHLGLGERRAARRPGRDDGRGRARRARRRHARAPHPPRARARRCARGTPTAGARYLARLAAAAEDRDPGPDPAAAYAGGLPAEPPSAEPPPP